MNRHRRRRQTFPRALVAEAVTAASAARGCTCMPDMTRRHKEGLAIVDVRHDDWCPAVNGGSQLVIARAPHETAAEFAAVIVQVVSALGAQPEPFRDVRIDGRDHPNPFEEGRL